MIILMRNMIPDIIIFKAICKGFTSEIPNGRPVLHIFVRSNTKDTMYHSFVSEFSCFENIGKRKMQPLNNSRPNVNKGIIM